MGKSEPVGTFSANSKYTITELASKMRVPQAWIKEHLVDSGECAHERRGYSYIFLGQWIINWCLADHEVSGRNH